MTLLSLTDTVEKVCESCLRDPQQVQLALVSWLAQLDKQESLRLPCREKCF